MFPLDRLGLAPAPLALPDQIREAAEGDLQTVGQRPVEQCGRGHLRLEDRERNVGAVSSGGVQTTDQRQLYDPDPARRDRCCREQARKREHGEDLSPADLLLADADVAKRDEKDEVQGDVAHDGRDGERRPALEHEGDRLRAEFDRLVVRSAVAESQAGSIPRRVGGC